MSAARRRSVEQHGSVCQLDWSPCRLHLAGCLFLALALGPALALADSDKPVMRADQLPARIVEPVDVVEPPPAFGERLTPGPGGGVQAFTGLLETRKRQLVTSYYLYRGPAPSDVEMASSLGAIDRLILQDYSLEDIWSTIFHIMISEPALAHRPFEEVIPPNIQRAHVWRQSSTPVKVVIEENYPEFDLIYKHALRRKRTFGYVGAAAFVPSYTLSIAFGSAQVGDLYDRSRAQDTDFNAAAAFLPVIPLIGPVLTQAYMDREARRMGVNDYDAGAHLVGAVWGTLMQALGMTAIVISITQPLPEPFGHPDPSTTAERPRRPRRKASLHAAISPNTIGFGMTF